MTYNKTLSDYNNLMPSVNKTQLSLNIYENNYESRCIVLTQDYLDHHSAEVMSIYFAMPKLNQPKVMISISGIKSVIFPSRYGKGTDKLYDNIMDVKNIQESDIYKDHFNVLLKNWFSQSDKTVNPNDNNWVKYQELKLCYFAYVPSS